MYDSVSSVQFIVAKYPHLSDELHDETWDGLLHLQMAVFSRWAQGVIDSGIFEDWHQIAETFLSLWLDCTPEVTNALNVSFLQHLKFNNGKKQRSWAYEKMPQIMRKAWDDMESYNQKIHGG